MAVAWMLYISLWIVAAVQSSSLDHWGAIPLKRLGAPAVRGRREDCPLFLGLVCIVPGGPAWNPGSMSNLTGRTGVEPRHRCWDREVRCGTSTSVVVPGGPVWNLVFSADTGRSGVEPRRSVRIPGGPVWNLARVSVRTGRSSVEPQGRCERLAPGAAPALVYVTSSTGPHRPHRT